MINVSAKIQDKRYSFYLEMTFTCDCGTNIQYYLLGDVFKTL